MMNNIIFRSNRNYNNMHTKFHLDRLVIMSTGHKTWSTSCLTSKCFDEAGGCAHLPNSSVVYNFALEEEGAGVGNKDSSQESE